MASVVVVVVSVDFVVFVFGIRDATVFFAIDMKITTTPPPPPRRYFFIITIVIISYTRKTARKTIIRAGVHDASSH